MLQIEGYLICSIFVQKIKFKKIGSKVLAYDLAITNMFAKM